MNSTLPILFNVRIYGLLIENDAILVSDEIHQGRMITKFPGGGLQFGEGTIDALKREFMEELQSEIRVDSHFYTVDFFQPSAFNPRQQVISIYYRVSRLSNEPIAVVHEPFAFGNSAGVNQVFRWIRLDNISENDFTFPIDRHVCGMMLA
jgi:ADP-ribose pyrophosphatase YjhB (NUDIX family)